MSFILETLLVAKLADIDPYSQPAVDQGKMLVKEIIQRNV